VPLESVIGIGSSASLQSRQAHEPRDHEVGRGVDDLAHRDVGMGLPPECQPVSHTHDALGEQLGPLAPAAAAQGGAASDLACDPDAPLGEDALVLSGSRICVAAGMSTFELIALLCAESSHAPTSAFVTGTAPKLTTASATKRAGRENPPRRRRPTFDRGENPGTPRSEYSDGLPRTRSSRALRAERSP
jgi:hypothetical protein